MKRFSDYRGIWILAEQHAGEIHEVSYELITRALELAEKRKTFVAALVFGNDLADSELRKLIIRGVDKVFCLEGANFSDNAIDSCSQAMLETITRHKPEVIIAGATTFGRSLMPYVAMRAHAGLTADCTLLDIDADSGELLQTRPAIGGNIMATIKTPEYRPQMATVRPKSSRAAAVLNERRSGEIIRLQPQTPAPRSRITGFIPDEEEISLQEADKVVIVGRGIKKAANLEMIRELAHRMGAALGASRDVVDRGWLSYPHQVGLSGKTISPKLCLSIGVSGAIQHLAGIKTAENIVAVNIDPEAQIFKVADFGITGDLFNVVPAMIKKLKTGKNINA